MKTFTIKKEMMEIWPKLKQTRVKWFFDQEYEVPTVAVMKIAIAHVQREIDIMAVEGIDCNGRAAIAMGRMKELKGSWAFGVVFTQMTDGQMMEHQHNFCMTDDGIYFIDPSDNWKVWKGTSQFDNPRWVYA